MKSKLNKCKCSTCTNCVIKADEKWGKRISCPYASGIEFLGDFCPDPLNDVCGHYKKSLLQQIVDEEM